MNTAPPLAPLQGLLLSSTLLCQQPPADWSSWRGPHQNGRIAVQDHFAGGFGLALLWKADLRQGYSSISVAGGKVLTMSTDGSDDLLLARHARTGDIAWRYRLGSMYRGHDGGHDGPPSTPVVARGVDGSTVFALGAGGKLVAVRLTDGREKWTVSLRAKLGSVAPLWGFCTTPVVAGDLVVVQAGGSNGRSLAAFTTRDGELRWASGHGTVEYRSPIFSTLNGRRQIVAATSSRTRGVDPATGRTLWNVPFVTNDYTTPVVIGTDRVLLEGDSSTVLWNVPRKGQPQQLWRSREFGGSNYGVPVAHEGHLYGFTGRYLTCVDLRTGRRVWRSRPPGGKGLIIVDGHLVVLASTGDVVVAAASPAGYRELARVSVSDASGYGWPAFAGSTIFVRNLRHIAAVRTTGSPPVLTAAPSTPSRFRTFLAKLAVAPDKRALLDEFMQAQRSFPIVEDDRLVHFVYRGEAADVGIRGNMLAHNEEDALTRVSGTDFFYRTYPIEPGARWEYRFNFDFDRVRRDPRNPRHAGARSEVVTNGWKRPDWLDRYDGNAAGRVESVRAGGYRVQVYLPHGYGDSDRRYPLLVVTEGRDWAKAGTLPNTLDTLIGDRMVPVVVAFVDASGHGALGGAGTQQFVRALAKKVVPALVRRYRIRADAVGRIVMGKRGAAVAAVCAALTYPEVFGQCVAISYGRADTIRGQWVAGRIRALRGPRPRFFIDWNRYEVWRPQSFDVRDQSRALAADLRKHGHVVLGGERADGAGWTSWRIAAGIALQTLLPVR